ncbi:TROVE domain-containing protein [Streptomyces sp. 5-10]|uniref:TROVE domain-containing protein n=1 Tax=Streptomyces sp. 5-10 TaxID=878925 RepID=UPI00168BDBDC|nr:TROVE domain-containing protein [Streptomyces sp. 5-10]MBD3004733.1 TROVE domain-containing protein [Streptomyces sp. 5-10]
MATFNTKGSKPRVNSPVTTTGTTKTALGASGFTRSSKSDLYLLSVSNMINKKTFHEPVRRNERYVDLVHTVALEDPEFITRMFPWVRNEGFMRSASVMGAAEAAHVLCDAHRYDGVEDMIDGTLSRADELGEFIAYWFSIAGKAWPRRYQPVKRGLKRAAQRLITEYSYGKWDSPRREYRLADIIDITHPSPANDSQSDLFKLILDRRRNRMTSSLANLPMIREATAWHQAARSNPKDKRLLDPAIIKKAGLTWEDMMSALGSHVPKAKVWEAVIPNMGVRALLDNLRNFDEANVSDKAASRVSAAISDPDRIRNAKVFPFRFLAALRATQNLRWAYPLEKGLNASLELVPSLSGSTLILVDRSPSMFPDMPGSTPNDSDISLADQAAVFGAALAIKASNPTLVEFGGDTGVDRYTRALTGKGSRAIRVQRGASALKVVEMFGEPIPGTDIPRAVKENFAGHDRVVIITDEQSRPGYLTSNMRPYGGSRETKIDDLIPGNTPVYLWNMAGYKGSILEASAPNRHAFGGLSDASFRMISLLESRRSVTWPWMDSKQEKVAKG